MARQCPYCDYDLSGLDEPSRCPECGNIVRPEFLESLMKHPSYRAERVLLWIAMAGWGAHILVFGLLILNFVVRAGLFGFVAAVLMMVSTLVIMDRSRASWPKRFVLARNRDAQEVSWRFLYALASWLIPSILVCGLFNSV